jgi:uncharacterized NAD-dependent epimerase/dehydratase family protein
LRYRGDEVVAILDSTAAGSSTSQLLGVDTDRPVVADLESGLRHRPDTLVIGIAPRGGGLPSAWRTLVLAAIDAGLDIVSGLHTMLADDGEIAARAAARGVELVDLRRPPRELRLPREAGEPPRSPPRVILTVGSDCNVGKMTAALEIVHAARARGVNAVMAATGQTGILIAGGGIAVDRVVADFMAGATEQLIDELGMADWVVVEGQGALLHPAYSGVVLAILHGARPDAMVICHHVGRHRISGYDVPIPGPARLLAIHEEAAAWVSPARVAAFALNAHGAVPEEVEAYVDRVRRETGRVAADPLTAGDALVEAILEQFN